MFFTPRKMDLDRDGRDWPHRDRSRFVSAFGVKWHVQELGSGERTIVLIHGTGASAHSWRDLMPLLAANHRVVAFDLPGQGFTDPFDDADPTLATMAAAVRALLKKLAVQRPVLIGHSAGAAIALQVALSDEDVAAVVSINGALYPFAGASSSLFPILAKMLFLNPVVPHVFAMGAGGGGHRVARLLEGTGSRLSAEGLSLYQRLFSNPSHVRATLAWMANWNLDPLVRDMSGLQVPFLQIIGGEDRTIPPGNAYETEQRIAQAETIMLSGFGHLVHEEKPDLVDGHLRAFLERIASPGPSS